LVDAKAMNPQSVMPAYYKVDGLTAVRTDIKNRPILTAQEIEDVLAYLVTLTAEEPQAHRDTHQTVMKDSDQLQAYTVGNRRSGFTYLTPDTQHLQNDEFANPGMLWVERGRELWTKAEGSLQKSCSSCHGEAEKTMRGVRARYPRFDSQQKKLITLEQQINHCRTEQLQVTPYAYESDPLLALTTYIAYQSRGMPIEPVLTEDTQPFLKAGETFFRQRRGQLDLACFHCHDQLAGQRLRGDVISQGQINGFPIYRQLWQTLGSTHRMFIWCNTAIRAQPLAAGSDAYVNLEFYLAWRARGLPVESPAVRR
jgi:sulfur-oxidizing protein SoxA